MNRRLFKSGSGRLLAAAVLSLGLSVPQAAQAAGAIDVPDHDFSFDGIFGTFDRMQLQRGFQVYREVCSVCHGLRLISFRNLGDGPDSGNNSGGLGYTQEQVKAFAAEYTIVDGPNDEGEMFERAGLPFDHYPSPFPNRQAAEFANGGAYPSDLSLMAKARKGGADYIYYLLTGYIDPPAGVDVGALHYNRYFPGTLTVDTGRIDDETGEPILEPVPGGLIAMAQPLWEDSVVYQDGTPATVEQMAEDVSAFLMWTAEPMLEDRKRMGIKVLIFLVVLTALFYAIKRQVWSKLH